MHLLDKIHHLAEKNNELHNRLRKAFEKNQKVHQDRFMHARWRERKVEEDMRGHSNRDPRPQKKLSGVSWEKMAQRQ